MRLAYIDESGDRGADGSRTYTIGCLLVRSSQWKDTFDGIIGFRRFLFNEFGLRVRAEIKANYLLRNGGPFRALKLSEHARHYIYKGLLRLQESLGLSVFAIVIDKENLKDNIDPLEVAWTYAIQRLERMSTKNGEEVLIIHDEGEPLSVRKLARKARRAGTAGGMFGGHLNVPFHGLLDDPVSRTSVQSYFLQLADLDAYAAFRRVFLPPPRHTHVVPNLMWDNLGSARNADVNKRAGGPSNGIVYWPKA